MPAHVLLIVKQGPSEDKITLHAHFGNRFLTQPDEQLGGVRETISNYLQYFLTPEVAEVFCTGESTFDFAAIDQGKIIHTTMPQKFQTERRYVNTLFKLLYYNHALPRPSLDDARSASQTARSSRAEFYKCNSRAWCFRREFGIVAPAARLHSFRSSRFASACTVSNFRPKPTRANHTRTMAILRLHVQKATA